MADGSFLPEDDQEFLATKSLAFVLLREELPEGEERRGIELPEFALPPNLFVKIDDKLVAESRVSLMVLIPKGYQETQLDSWYISPAVYLKDGQQPDRANSEAVLFGRPWQFWSRHLAAGDWRAGVDGLETYLQYIRTGLRSA